MDTNRLSKNLSDALNGQMMQEAHAAQIYLSYAAWLKHRGYDGMANFLFRHAGEERNHMMKILEYILERGAKVIIASIPDPGDDPTNVFNCFEKFFGQEVQNTNSIYKLVKMSFDEQDWATWHFMQWFVKEQTEEETLAMNLLDKLKIAGGEKANPDALYQLDKDLAKTPDEARLAEDATTQDP
jgi:ferritin